VLDELAHRLSAMPTRRLAALSVAVCAVSLALGFALKSCPSSVEETRLSFACHTDITALYEARDVDDRVFPYVQGRLEGDRDLDGELTGYDLRLLDGANEYPVLTGVTMWLAGLPVDDADSYLAVTALVMTPMGLATAWVLGLRSGPRALLWSASPALILYAFHNWELPVVLVATLGFVSWSRRRPASASAWFGVGAALKLYPILFLVPLVLERLRDGDRRGAIRSALIGPGVFLALNLPIWLASPDGWRITWDFHRLRPPNYDSLFGVGSLYDLGPSTINLISSILVVASIVAVSGWGWKKSVSGAAYPFVQTSAAILCVFLLWNKVHSPQYVLWLLPFFVVLKIRWWWYAATMAVAVAAYVSVFMLGTFSLRALRLAVPTVVYGRAVLLAVLAAVVMGAPLVMVRPEVEP
jgi:uncharacterized membrane protein